MFRIVEFAIPSSKVEDLVASGSSVFKDFYKAAQLSPFYAREKNEHVSIPMATTQKGFFYCEQLLRSVAADPSSMVRDITRKYSLLRTRAPRAYDYEYVIEIGRMEGEFGEERIVAIPKDKVEYQSGRYASGLYTPVSCA